MNVNIGLVVTVVITVENAMNSLQKVDITLKSRFVSAAVVREWKWDFIIKVMDIEAIRFCNEKIENDLRDVLIRREIELSK